ncbi:MAG: hypothetical protein R2838_17980 [Caldilineaceae bacterium]
MGQQAAQPGRLHESAARRLRQHQGRVPVHAGHQRCADPGGRRRPLRQDDFAYLEGMYQNGLARYADGIGVHPSGYNVPPSVGWQEACAVIQQTGNFFNGPCDTPTIRGASAAPWKATAISWSSTAMPTSGCGPPSSAGR